MESTSGAEMRSFIIGPGKLVNYPFLYCEKCKNRTVHVNFWDSNSHINLTVCLYCGDELDVFENQEAFDKAVENLERATSLGIIQLPEKR